MKTSHSSKGSVVDLDPDQIAEFARNVLLDPNRDYPVVALTTDPRRGRSLLDPAAVADELQDLAQVVLLRTGDATWALTECLPPRLDVYGGAARIWWPGMTLDSNPLDHRLYFIYDQEDADPAFDRIVQAVRRLARLPHAGPSAPDRTEAPRQSCERPEAATVTAVSPGGIEVASAARRAVIVDADIPIELLSECLVPGCSLDVRFLRLQGDGQWACSVVGLLPNPWDRLKEEIRTGDVLVGRVRNVCADLQLIFVDILPGVVGVCHISELDYCRIDDIHEYARVGDLLPFQVLEVDPERMRLLLSRRQAYGQDPRPSPSLYPGGNPFVWKSDLPMFENLRRRSQRGNGDDPGPRLLARRLSAGPAPTPTPDADDEVQALTAELAAARDERTNLVAQIRELRLQNQQLKRELRSADDRFAALERRTIGELEPLSSERAFLLAIRLCHGRMFEEHDRLRFPLRRMRIGTAFLRSVRELDGIDVEKIVEVCAQVAAGIANTLPAREVHQLRDGPRGAGGRTRTSDNAKAWRCSLQDNTASARRLHWWSVPGSDGGIVEFANVGVHDDFSIPE